MPAPHGAAPAVRRAYEECERLVRSHYENFPVASLLLPRVQRPALAAVYAFARTADDFADEGSLPAGERLARLDAWEQQLDACYAGRPQSAVFVALADTVARYGIPRQPLADLLTAFRMDVTTRRHRSFDDLLRYCRHSADPVGRIVLHLFGDASPGNLMLSDRICTALQLANFWQDVSVDLAKDRVYLPLDDFERFGYTERELLARESTPAFRALLRHQVERTRDIFEQGKPLLTAAAPALRRELRMTWLGGTAILAKIAGAGYDTLRARPALSGTDKARILVRALAGFI